MQLEAGPLAEVLAKEREHQCSYSAPFRALDACFVTSRHLRYDHREHMVGEIHVDCRCLSGKGIRVLVGTGIRRCIVYGVGELA